ncbi:YdgA family protein [Acidovorax sp. BL-A-41-H1]|uniref:YdgA family protein n=1 Tax=Acidovorax sp. BL-A-41-H1 TaxID=3421102 RepID=UPI003F7B1D90
MNKKTVWGTAAVVLVGGYGAATWYMGERAHSSYQEAMNDMAKLLGPEVLVSQRYTKGFWSSKGQLVLQWTPPASEDEPDAGGGAATAAAPPAIRFTVENTVRHGPLAGWRVAAAVVETRLVGVEGADDPVRKTFAKVTAPTLTTVRHLTGSHDFVLALPAGEVGDGEEMVRWQSLAYRMKVNAGVSRVSGDFDWPEFTMDVADKGEDDDAPAVATAPTQRLAVALQGMKGEFNLQLEDGLWLLAPGSGKGTIGKLAITRAAGAAPGVAPAAPEPMVALRDLSYGVTIARNGAHLGWVTAMQGKGSVGPVALESLELNETVSRIDVEAVKLVQKALLDAYKTDPSTAVAAVEAPWIASLMDAVPKFVAALPAYAMKLSAKVDGEQGELEYGVELKRVPDAAQIAEGAWAPALLKSSAVHASMRLPKAWLPRLAQAAGQQAPKPEEIDALVGMAEAQGYIQQEASHLTSAVRMEDGRVVLNGKAADLPFGRK